MSQEPRLNELDQPIGAPVEGWSGARLPDNTPLQGRYCRLEKLAVDLHSDQLFDALAADQSGALWTYLSEEPPESRAVFRSWMDRAVSTVDPFFYAVIERATGKALGRAALMRIAPAAGSIEVGSILFSPRLQRTPVATEAMFLMMQHAFDHLGYRRYEWKCDSLNEPSRRAAERFGFSYEGTFRQALVYKGRSRDTAWFSIVDGDWPAFRRGYERWFDPANFDENGRQKQTLASFIGGERQLAG